MKVLLLHRMLRSFRHGHSSHRNLDNYLGIGKVVVCYLLIMIGLVILVVATDPIDSAFPTFLLGLKERMQ